MTVAQAKQVAQYYTEYANYLAACTELERLLNIPYLWNVKGTSEYDSNYPTLDAVEPTRYKEYFTGWYIDNPIKQDINAMLKHFPIVMDIEHPFKNEIRKNARIRDKFLAANYNMGGIAQLGHKLIDCINQ